MEQALHGVILSIVFAILGFALLFIGYKVFDLLTPKDLAKIIFEDGNVAAAVLTGAFVIALGIIVAHAIS
jgi:putative membrane protein